MAQSVVLCVLCPGPLCSCSPVCTLDVLCCVCGVLGHLAPVHRCARSVCCAVCAVSWALGSCSLVCTLGVLCCVCSFLGHLLLFTSVHARCVVMFMRCAGQFGSCSPVCTLDVLCWVCSVLGHLAPVVHCARPLCSAVCALFWASWLLCTGVHAGYVVCAVSFATWLLFTSVHARCVGLCVWCPRPLGSLFPACVCVLLCVRYSWPRGARSPACTCGVLCARVRLLRVCGVCVGVGCVCVGCVLHFVLRCFRCVYHTVPVAFLAKPKSSRRQCPLWPCARFQLWCVPPGVHRFFYGGCMLGASWAGIVPLLLRFWGRTRVSACFACIHGAPWLCSFTLWFCRRRRVSACFVFSLTLWF